jgi:hypothetical protein
MLNRHVYTVFSRERGLIALKRNEVKPSSVIYPLRGLLFDATPDNISLRLKNIFRDGELAEVSVAEEFSATATERGKRI